MENGFRQLRAPLFPLLMAGLWVLALACVQPPGPTETPVPTSTPAPTPTPTPPPDPRAILARAAERLSSDTHLEFTLEHPAGSTPLATGLNLVGAEGVASLPDRFRLVLYMEASGTVLKLDVIVLGERAFMTNLFGGAWEPVPKEQIPFRFDFVTESVASLLAGMDDLTLMADEELEGGPAYVIHGVGPTEALTQLIPGTLPDSTIRVELWVSKADGRLRQVQLTGPLVAGDLPETVRVVRLKSLGDAPEIEAPEVGATVGEEN